MQNKLQKAFTIVELLIVIAVIGILVSISVVSYSGAQARARDIDRRNDIDRVSEALGLYDTATNTMMGAGSGCGANGDGNGWVSYTDSTMYLKSIETCLIEKGYLAGGARDPIGPNSGTSPVNKNYAYMKYNCTVNGEEKSYVFAKLETLPQGDVIKDPICNNTAVDTTYGMNYYVEVK